MKKLTFIFIAFGLLSSCDSENSIQTETLNGIWHLKNVNGGF